SVLSALDDFAHVERLIVLPLFPQYSSTTTGAVWDAVNRYFAGKKRIPELYFIRDYASHPDYIFALVKTITDCYAANAKPDRLLFSYHGIPQRYVTEGDDYAERCELTTA